MPVYQFKHKKEREVKKPKEPESGSNSARIRMVTPSTIRRLLFPGFFRRCEVKFGICYMYISW